MNLLAGKVALVTGSSRGIGHAIARRLSQDGAAIAVNYLRNANEAQTLVAELEKAGANAAAFQADVARVADIARLFDQAIAHFSKIDILVNSAGIMFKKPVADVTEEEFDRIFGVNVKGTFFACQQAARRLADHGRIINFSSTTTAMMLPTYGPYVATKGAVEQLTRSLAWELAPRGITVNSISPGPTDTEMFNAGKTGEQKRALARAAAFDRIGEPMEIADAVAYLAGDSAKWITGQNIRVNGGVA